MTNTPAVYTPQQLRHLSRIVKAEREVAAATMKALQLLGQAVRDQLTNDGYTATVLDSRAPVWREQLAEQIMPTIARVYDQGFRSQTRATTAAIMPSGEAVPGDFGMADHLATQYLQTVHNRMVGVADDVFAVIAAALEEGRQATYTLADGTSVVGDSIPQLAARVQAVLADNTRWSGDATRVARTEVIGANNAGAHAAAYNNAELFGSSSTEVIKEWLSTADERTRETHRIGGQKVLGLDTPFSVGGASLQQPGDPAGPAGEVINCRCTALYHYPGDPGYDEMATALGAAPAPEVTAQSGPLDLASPAGTSEPEMVLTPAEDQYVKDSVKYLKNGGSTAQLRKAAKGQGPRVEELANHAIDVKNGKKAIRAEADYVDRLHTALVNGDITPAELVLQAQTATPLGQANARAALAEYTKTQKALLPKPAFRQAITPTGSYAELPAKEATTWANNIWPSAKAYTEDQLDALRAYTGNSYSTINGALRKRRSMAVSRDFNIKNIDAAIEEAPRVPENMTVYRGTSLEQFGIRATDVDLERLNQLIGEEYIDYGYLSTTIAKGSRFDTDVAMTIRVPAGSKGIYVSGSGAVKSSNIISQVGGKERELIFARGSRMRIVSVKKGSNGKWQIEAELIQEAP